MRGPVVSSGKLEIALLMNFDRRQDLMLTFAPYLHILLQLPLLKLHMCATQDLWESRQVRQILEQRRPTPIPGFVPSVLASRTGTMLLKLAV